jgi:signal-transduction protein with cAMP-binding, CBS, and nucleotidyltransferase domain
MVYLLRVNHKKVSKEPESTENHALNVLVYGLTKSKIHTLISRENGNARFFVNANENKNNKIYQNVTKEEMKFLKKLFNVSHLLLL